MGVDYLSLNSFDKNDLERLSILKHYFFLPQLGQNLALSSNFKPQLPQ